MKSIIKLMCISTLFLGSATELHAEEPVQEQEKVGFFKRAFNDMKESTRAQHEVDKANFAAVKAESKAQWEEAKAMGNPKTRKEALQAQRDKQIEEANKRKADAEARIGKAQR